jgi:hypothetical protein
MDDIEYRDSLVDVYTNSKVFERKYTHAVGMNFLEFASTFESVKTKDEVRLRGDPRKYAFRMWEKYSANLNGNQFDLHCKYQLLRFKSWFDRQTDALATFDDTAEGWVEAWRAFLLTDEGKAKVQA